MHRTTIFNNSYQFPLKARKEQTATF